MDNDFKELLSAFNAHGVKYLVVGGYAVSFHAQPRSTKDLDLFLKADPENAQAIVKALEDFGAPMQGISGMDFEVPGSFYQIGERRLGVDLLLSLVGLAFDEAWERRVVVKIDAALEANYISPHDLVANKLATGRKQDLADVESLRAAFDSGPDASKRS